MLTPGGHVFLGQVMLAKPMSSEQWRLQYSMGLFIWDYMLYLCLKGRVFCFGDWLLSTHEGIGQLCRSLNTVHHES